MDASGKLILGLVLSVGGLLIATASISAGSGVLPIGIVLGGLALLFSGGIDLAGDRDVRRFEEDSARQETGKSIIFWSSFSIAAINSQISAYTIDMLIYIAQTLGQTLNRPRAIQLLDGLKKDKLDFVNVVRERRTEIRRQDAEYLIQAMAMVALTDGDISAAAAARLESVRNALRMSRRRFRRCISTAREAVAGEPDA